MTSLRGGPFRVSSRIGPASVGPDRLLPVVVALFALARVSYAQSNRCPQDAEYYEAHGYIIRSITIVSPFSFLQAEKRDLSWLKAGLPFSEGQPFSRTKFNNGTSIVERELRTDNPLSDEHFKLVVVTGRLLSCDSSSSPPKLDVEYHILTSDYRAYTSHLFEVKKSLVEQPATTSGTENTQGWLSAQPTLDYNSTIHLAGGIAGTARLPNEFGSLGADYRQSSSSIRGQAQYYGETSTGSQLVNHLEWRLDYSYYKMPAAGTNISQGLLTLQLLGATKPFGAPGFTFRYGVSVEGGNQQTTAPVGDLQTVDRVLPGSGYEAFKSYFGVTSRNPRQSFAGSYGMEYGSADALPGQNFVKHLADVNYLVRLHGKLNDAAEFHRLLTLEAEVAGGLIQHPLSVPGPERFFGGNDTQFFMTGDTWTIRDGPLVRSIPQNGLDGTAPGMPGGTGFYSLNTTWSFPVWGRALIPSEVTRDSQFRTNLRFAENSAT
ncbi:MAG TPA: hypothetical protein VI756_04260, partial [Blastocatellia bacterium]